ncbi:uncharacterized protein METZ01_LOCUS260709, partial [marine metagenome]
VYGEEQPNIIISAACKAGVYTFWALMRRPSNHS